MPRSAHVRATIQIHVCVVVWGFTAILGKLISLPALALVIWRMGIVAVLLLALPRVRRAIAAMTPRHRVTYAGIGLVVAIHWVTFYAAVKLANASVAATTMALAPVFLAFVEPFVAKRRFDPREILFGAAVVPGIVLVLGGIPAGMRVGFAIGVASAFFVAIFASLNKRFIHHADALAVTCVELGAGACLLGIVAFVLPHHGSAVQLPGARDAALLAVFATACTIFPFALSLVALRQLTAFSAQLAVNLEPVYALFFGIVLLGEQHQLDTRFYLGFALLLGAVFAHPLLVARSPAVVESS
jgi:drug/metabolite transporter (DMT)-like permease